MYGFTLIFVLAFIGGVIAYFGDKIGMKVGRKRLTIFGLRPKHTSVVITVFTGIFISAASITILSVASDDVRTALFEMKEIQVTLVSNQRQLEQSMQVMESMEDSLKVIVAERDRAETDLNEAQSQLGEVNKQLEELEYRRASLKEEYNTLSGEYTKLTEDYFELFADFLKFGNLIRFGNVALQADEIVYSQAIQGGRSLDEVIDDVLEFLNKADKIAYQLGARVDDQSQAAIIIDQKTVDMTIHSIAREPQLFVLRAVSNTNTLVGEPVFAYLELIRNEILYEAGTVLAEITVDLDITPEVDKHILALLNYAKTVAIKAGMITNNGGAVELSGEEFFDTISEAKELSGIITIKAKAAEDTYPAVGPLMIELEIVQSSR